MKHVVIRSSQSGVWFGKLESQSGDSFTLLNARRAYYWEGAATCSQLATHGPKGGKICLPVSRVQVLGVCECLDASEAAVKQWNEVPAWQL